MNPEFEGRSTWDQIKMIYDPKKYPQALPFDTYSPTDRIGDVRDRSEQETKPVLVDTGRMVVVDKKSEVLTDGLWGCAALFIEGQQANSLTHMVSGNDPRKFGYWPEHNYDPLPETGREIESTLPMLGDTNQELKALVIANKTSEGREHVMKLKEKLQEAGIDKVRVVEVPLQSTLVHRSPDTPDKLRVIGINESKGDAVEDCEILIEGEDEFID